MAIRSNMEPILDIIGGGVFLAILAIVSAARRPSRPAVRRKHTPRVNRYKLG
jgi:hypothetical protein